MKIISDFHDYYDIGMKNGYDPQLPYRRFRREEPVHLELASNHWRWRKDRYTRYNLYFFGFAGAIYPAIGYAFESPEMDYCFDFDNVDQQYYDDLAENHFYWGRKSFRELREKERKDALSELKKGLRKLWDFKNSNEMLLLFEQFQTAIFVYKLGEEKLVLNERLNVYGFQKILSPPQAFQELEMYVGSYLTKPTIEEPPISDKIKAEIHGFDKYSFRKEKQ